ncbi:MAG: pyridoxal-phosphate dependent enzyme [Desulfurococcaceae archaeon]
MPGIWRYSNMLPPLKVKISLGEGNTPLLRSMRIAKGKNVYFKNEGCNPTGSIRDRAASLVVSHASSEGYKRVIAVSDGNMGVSVAAYATRAGLKASIYAPSWIEKEKIFLIKTYGAKLVIEDKGIDALLKEVDGYSSRVKAYNASSTHNALSMEGLKTLSYELYMQLGSVPRRIYVPIGSGLTFLALHYGFKELLEGGFINKVPEIIGVEHCGNPKYASFLGISKKCMEEPYPGLRYYAPPIFNSVIDILRKHGDLVVVSSRETIRAAKILALQEGLFTEISSAVVVAGYLKTELEDSVIVLFSHGLKSASGYTRPLRRRFTQPFIGATKRLILGVLETHKGLTGYEIWRNLDLNITPQAVYQHLKELTDRGYIRAVQEGDVKRYYLP